MEELEYEASDERHQVLLRSSGVDEESKMVSRAALKSEEIDGAGEPNSLEAAEAKTPSSAFELFHFCVQQWTSARRWRERPSKKRKRFLKVGRYLTGVSNVTWVMMAWENQRAEAG